MSKLFHFNRSSTTSNNSDKTLVGSEGRVSPTSMQYEEKGNWVPKFEKENFTVVLEAARETIRVLRSIGVHSCAMGDLACKILGATRVPTEVDLLVMSEKLDHTALVRRLTFHNKRLLSAVIPSTPQAPLPPGSPPQYALYYGTPAFPIPVHLHIPPTPAVPSLTSADIIWQASFPLLPLPLLLLAKLRTWAEGRLLPPGKLITLEERRRQWVEHADLEVLLAQVVRAGLRIRRERTCAAVFAESGEDLQRWVGEYVSVYPNSRTMWTRAGLLSVPEKQSQGLALSRTQSRSSATSAPVPSSPVPPLPRPRPSVSSLSSPPAATTMPPRSHIPMPIPMPAQHPAPPRPPPPREPPAIPRPTTVLGHLRAKSPFMRKKSSAKLRDRAREESYFDWDD